MSLIWRIRPVYCHFRATPLLLSRQTLRQIVPLNGEYQWKREIRTSTPLQIGPWILGTPIARFAIAIAGRYARRWWRDLSDGEKARVTEYVRERRETILLFCLGGLGLFICYIAMHMEEAPITGRRRLIWVSDEDLAAVSAAEFKAEIDKYADAGLVVDPSHQAYKVIKDVVERILTANQYKEVQEINWKLFVVAKDDANAMTYPTGEIVVYTGLVKQLKNLDELAVILGHEISHAVLRHGQERLSVASLIDTIFLFPLGLIWFLIPFDSIAFLIHSLSKHLVRVAFHLPYSRKLETEADVIGLLFAARACYNPNAGPHLWSHFDKSTPEEQRIAQYRSTHPASEQRTKVLHGMLPMAMSLWKTSECDKMTSAQKQFKKATGRSWTQKILG